MRTPDFTRRVAVTGLGVISPVGNDRDTAWNNLVRGVSGIAEITHFDVSRYEQKAAGEVRDFDARAWMDPKAARRSESSLHFGVAAAKQALADSGFVLDDSNRTDVGVVFGSGAGGQQLMIDNWTTLNDKGPDRVAPTLRPASVDLGPQVSRLGRNVVCIPARGLDELATGVIDATAGLGEPPEERPFRGHITLARLRRRAACGLTGAPFHASFDANRLHLVQSITRSEGAEHTVVRSWDLTA